MSQDKSKYRKKPVVIEAIKWTGACLKGEGEWQIRGEKEEFALQLSSPELLN
jgi:hypothetical protein